MIPDLTQDEIRQRLVTELARLSDGGPGPAREQGGLVNLDKDDRAHNFAARERRLALKDLDAQKVAQIEAALERLDEGRYGICADCGEPIPAGRLEIIPYATHCVACQQAQA